MTSIKNHFDSLEDYDTCSDHVVPWNDEIQQAVYSSSLDFLGWKSNGICEVLDLGVGTSHGAMVFLVNNKNSRLTGVDFSGQMLEKARKTISSSGLAERVELVDADFTQWTFPEKKFDLVFSAIAIHNISNERKRKLFSGVFDSLKDGGIFINGDFIHSEGEAGQNAWNQFYQSHMRKHLSGKELDVWMHHAFVEDKPAKLSEQQAWLEEAGFSDFGVIWQKHNLAVYFARKL